MQPTKTSRFPLLLLWSIMISFAGTTAYAQTSRVTGTVINERTTAPAEGATITVKNTNVFTVADRAGKFSIEAASGNVLVITMIGHVTKEVIIGKNTGNILVKLAEMSSQLNDVVVIGYGRAKRGDLTGGISSVSGAELRKTSPTTFDQALQGKVAGVVVQQISGQPGGGVSIQIHGISSISGSNSPLYVIDGV
ncbi:MAG: carboxypeptidase-like regulatory domain-containing protein, partial [Ferruginibacter sp.]